jgi:hypothetical protein
MYGAAMARAEMRREERFEETRKKWVETIELPGGRSVEFLLVKCECCGQPWPRQKVIRLRQQEMSEWKRIREHGNNPGRAELAIILSIPFLLGAIAVIGDVSSHLLLAWLISMAIIPWSCASVLTRLSSARRKTMYEALTKILAKHGDLPDAPVHKVGMEDEWQREYVVLQEV